MFILSTFLNFSFKFSKYDFYILNSFRFHSIDFRILDINPMKSLVKGTYIVCLFAILGRWYPSPKSSKSCPYSPRKGSPGSNRYKIKSKIGATLSEF